jgi:replicative DNA helicase
MGVAGLPSAVEAERMVLGSMLIGTLKPSTMEAALSPNDFGLEIHRRIARAACELGRKGEGVSRAAIYQEVKADGGKIEVSDMIPLTDNMPVVVDLDGFMRSVKNAAIRRKLIFACQETMNKAILENDISDHLISAQKAISTLQSATNPDIEFHNPREIIEESGGIYAFFKSLSAPGVLSPWGKLNAYTNGIHPGNLVIIAGGTSRGKTALAMNYAHHAAVRGTGVAIYSLEMDRRELSKRLISIAGQISSSAMRNPQNGDASKILKAAYEVGELPIYICDNNICTLPSIENSLRRLIAKHEVGMAIVDYLNLVTPSTNQENRVQEISRISRGLKMLAREFGIPIMALCQLNRDAIRENRRPELQDLRESGSIEQDADVVGFLHSDQKYERGDGPEWLPVEFILAKQRNGRAKVTIDMLLNPAWGLFVETEKREEPEDEGAARKRNKRNWKEQPTAASAIRF